MAEDALAEARSLAVELEGLALAAVALIEGAGGASHALDSVAHVLARAASALSEKLDALDGEAA